MSKTVDKLQQQLQNEVFHYAQDKKKAAGRALGTIVEIVTYYKVCSWGFSPNLLIEKPVPEFGKPDIRHNVEFSLHPLISSKAHNVPKDTGSLTAKRLAKIAGIEVSGTANLLSSKALLRNAAVLCENEKRLVVANLMATQTDHYEVALTELKPIPRAIFECKRVGVEEGMKKGPQSIEKAKQGAYVARSVSSLQKVRMSDGQVMGFLPTDNGKSIVRNYDELLADVLSGKVALPPGFVLTVGVVSNHGNWFTDKNMNKEMKVLASAYDWLLFLTDEGLLDFVESCILSPTKENVPIQKAFMDSYNGGQGGTRFTKTTLDIEADRALRKYFLDHAAKSNKWFNVIAPSGKSIELLSKQLRALLKA